jgi:ribosomal protein L11 methyltransferase
MWLSLKLPWDGEGAEPLADALLAAGALSVSIEDRDAGTAAELAQFGEPGEHEPHAWHRNWVVALLPEDADVAALIRRVGLPQDIRRVEEIVQEQDWVRLTQSQFEPLRITDRIWIVPSWHDAPDPGAVNIELDPGLAFGTGSHPTTRLCLRWLAEHIRGGETVLDYGCGSGILAIAAARLGAGRILGVDIDPQAVTAARDNAKRNGVSAEFCLPDAVPAGQVDTLVANILTNPLKALAPLLGSRVAEGGLVVLSGILESQAEEVMDVYRQAFTMEVWAVEEGWVCLMGRKS